MMNAFHPALVPSAGWVSAIFQYLVAPTIVGLVAATAASRQFRHNVSSERQRSASKMIDELTIFGRKVDERLRLCDKAFKTESIFDLPILADLMMPDLRSEAVSLGPAVAMNYQMLKDSLSNASEEVTFLHISANEAAVAGDDPDIKVICTFVGPAIEDVLIHLYRTIDGAAKSARLPYKQVTRVSLRELELRGGLRIQVHPNDKPGRLPLTELIRPSPH